MKIQTLHPDPGKQGVNIDREKYETVKTALLEELHQEQPVSFKELSDRTKTRLGSFAGSKSWYITTVKLDLEARGLIVVERRSSPQSIRLKS